MWILANIAHIKITHQKSLITIGSMTTFDKNLLWVVWTKFHNLQDRILKLYVQLGHP